MVAMVTKLIETRRQKDSGKLVREKLNQLADLNFEKEKANEVGLQNLYHDSFLLRILEMLDFFSSLALSSPASLALIQKFIEPKHLQYLLKLLVSGLPRMKVIAVKIF